MNPMQRRFALPAYVALAAAVVLAVAWPAAVQTAQYWPLLLSLVVLGLPHGAVDHHVPRRLGAPTRQRSLVAAYLVVTAAGVALWWLAPYLALGVFLATAALHWGAGDVWFSVNASGRAPFRRRWHLVAFVAARGLVPVALPLLAHPAAALDGMNAILTAVGADAIRSMPGERWRGISLAALGAIIAASLLASVLDHRQPGQRRAGLLDGAEIVLLTVTMVVVSPVFAVGMYFIVWHAARHVARLMACEPTQAGLMRAGRWPQALALWHREAAPLTLLSLAGLALLAAAVWRAPVAQEAIVGASLALIAALTVPHALVVLWMDRAQLAGRLAPPPGRSDGKRPSTIGASMAA